eukprot:1158304-Pelagomonas_calceolata.AAC.5
MTCGSSASLVRKRKKASPWLIACLEPCDKRQGFAGIPNALFSAKIMQLQHGAYSSPNMYSVMQDQSHSRLINEKLYVQSCEKPCAKGQVHSKLMD